MNQINLIPLSCPNCGGQLKLPKHITHISCAFCDTELVLSKGDGYFALEIMNETISKIDSNTQKAASEMALARLKPVLKSLISKEEDLFKRIIQRNLYDSEKRFHEATFDENLSMLAEIKLKEVLKERYDIQQKWHQTGITKENRIRIMDTFTITDLELLQSKITFLLEEENKQNSIVFAKKNRQLALQVYLRKISELVATKKEIAKIKAEIDHHTHIVSQF